MSVEKAKTLCKKYAEATEYFDDFVEKKFVSIPLSAQKFINQVTKEILEELKEV